MTPPRGYRLDIGEGARIVSVQGTSSDPCLQSKVGAEPPREVLLLASAPRLVALVDGKVVALSLGAPSNGESAFSFQGSARVLSRPRPEGPARAPNKAVGGLLTAPMPGRVVQVNVREGDDVPAGAPLVVIEAMKMQNALFAPRAGRVARVFVSEGAPIERGAKLVELSLSEGAER